jgi:hypothetical protein
MRSRPSSGVNPKEDGRVSILRRSKTHSRTKAPTGTASLLSQTPYLFELVNGQADRIDLRGASRWTWLGVWEIPVWLRLGELSLSAQDIL